MKIYIPKEHGSWAILLIPYFIGVAITGDISSRTALGLIGILMLFFIRQPLLLILKNRNNYKMNHRALWLNFLIPLMAGLGIFFWLMLNYQLWQLWLIGCIGLMLFSLYIYLFLQRKERSIPGELVGIFLLSLSSTVAVALAQGKLTSQALLLWLVNALYFSSSVFYIKMKLAARNQYRKDSADKKDLSMIKNCLAYLAILMIIVVILIFADWLPGLIILAFVPMIVHTLWHILVRNTEVKIMREGWIQVGLSIIYAFMVVISYQI
ncbi:MAG: YwiC-like family protein [bacterium]|nr:YwiC-like family protein [bacterium]